MNALKKTLQAAVIIAALMFMAGISPKDGFAYVHAAVNELGKYILRWFPREVPMAVLEQRIANARAELGGSEVDLSLSAKQIEHDKGEVESLTEKIKRARKLAAAASTVLEAARGDHADTVEFAGKRRPVAELELEIDQLIASVNTDEGILDARKRALIRLKDQHARAELHIADNRIRIREAESKLREIKVRWEIARQEHKQISRMNAIRGTLLGSADPFAASLAELDQEVSRLEAQNRVATALDPPVDSLSRDFHRPEDAKKTAAGD